MSCLVYHGEEGGNGKEAAAAWEEVMLCIGIEGKKVQVEMDCAYFHQKAVP